MAKFDLTFKTPDVTENGGFYDACIDLMNERFVHGVSEEEKPYILLDMSEELKKFLGKWLKYGECVTIEFDTEAGTAKVV